MCNRKFIIFFAFASFFYMINEIKGETKPAAESTFNEQLLQAAVANAPHFRYKADIFQKRLQHDNFQPLVDEFSRLIYRYAQGNSTLNVSLNPLQSSSLNSVLQSTRKINTQSGLCWKVSAAFSQAMNRYLVVWEDSQENPDDPDIYGQVLDQFFNPVGSNFRVNMAIKGTAQTSPAVAALSTGGFVVIWEDYRATTPAIYMKIFNTNMQPTSSDLKVADDQLNEQYFPDVSADGLGSFWVVWLQNDNGDFNVYARKFSSSGTPSVVSFKVNTDTKNALQWNPSAASLQNGQTLIVWEDQRNVNSDIYAQAMRPDASRVSGNFMVIRETGDNSRQWRPFVEANGNRFVVCWEDFRLNKGAIFAQWFDEQIKPLWDNIRVDDADGNPAKEYPVVGIDGAGRCLFAWQVLIGENWNLQVKAGTDPQSLMNPILPPLDDPSRNRIQPQVVLMPETAALFWLGESNEGYFQNVFGALFPISSFVPVELVSFQAKVIDTSVFLQWQTLSESNNLGFEIERNQAGSFIGIGFVPGNGTTTVPHFYSFIDENLDPGTYSYRLKQIDTSGETHYYVTEEIQVKGPSSLTLDPNFPNPFNSQTCFSFSLPDEAYVNLYVTDLNGRRVSIIVTERLRAGRHRFLWDGKDYNGNDLPTGMYFYYLNANNDAKMGKLILLR